MDEDDWGRLNIYYRLEILYGNFNCLLILPWNKRKEGALPLATQLLAYLLSPLKTLGGDGGCVLAKLDDQIILAVVLASESNDVWCKGIWPLFPKKGLTKYFSVIFFRPDFSSVDLY